MFSFKSFCGGIGTLFAYPYRKMDSYLNTLTNGTKVFISAILLVTIAVLSLSIQNTLTAIDLQNQYQVKVQEVEKLKEDHEKAKQFYKSHVMRLVRQRDVLSEAKNNTSKPVPVISVGIGNNNLGNVKKPDSGHWQGTIGYDRRNFAVFSHHIYSIRATAITLIAYQMKHKINTIDALIDRYSKTDRAPYKAYVSKCLGIGINERFSIVNRLPELIDAIITYEVSTAERKACGVTKQDILNGCRMAMNDSKYLKKKDL